MLHDEKKFLTIQEAADFLKVSKTSLRRWTNSSRLPCYRIGKRNERRFLIADLLECLSSSEAKTSASKETIREEATLQHTEEQASIPQHISTYYRNESEQWKSLEPHLFQHLGEKARMIYIYDSDAGIIEKQLLKIGLDPMKLQREKTLHLISSEQAYLRNDVFIPSRMLEFWQKLIGQAMMDGINKILLTGEMGWAVRGLPGSELLCSYEKELDQFIANFPMVTVICQYPVKEFSGDIIFESLCTHPHIQMNENIITGLNI